jgi:Lysyl oxidase
MTRVIALRVLPVVMALLLAAVTIGAADRSGVAAARAERLLPDLDQATPRGLVITSARRGGRVKYRLGFGSAVSNVGDGPLVITGHRSGLDDREMTADQLVERDGAPQEVVSGVGWLRYVVSPDHRHWHLLGFDRYELRRAGRPNATVGDRKSGFCLGDRYRAAGRPLPSAPARPLYTSRCGLGDTGLLEIEEGISVGYGDYYKPTLEGQYLPLSGLPGGRYVLAHRVNRERRLRELDYGNNAASLLFALRWRHGRPEIRVQRSCPGTDRCDRRRPREGSAIG